MPSPQSLAAAEALFDVNLVDDHATRELVASFIDSAFMTPNTALPPLDPTAPRRKMVITIEVAADFEKRLDNQWMVEREIAADRWSWAWADDAPHGVTCTKVSHDTAYGYLHAAEDDGPYDVDGVPYCGRCHTCLP